MRLNAFGILCADVAASLEFYRLLGVEFPEYEPEVGHYSAELGGGIRLMLDSHEVARSFIEDFVVPTGNDLMTLAVEFDTPAQVDTAFAGIRAAGGLPALAGFAGIVAAGYRPIPDPFDAFWGQRYATVSDPDGNQVDLYAQLPTA